jgi:tetratricopeptide (TPR) repeat protein
VEGGNGVVVFVNSDEGNIILELLNSVAAVYHWKGFDKPKNINTITVPESITKKYTGVYLYEGKFAEITKENDGLRYWADGQTCLMYFTSKTDFINLEFPTEKSFRTDANGTVTGYERIRNGNKLPPATKLVLIDTIKPQEGQWNAFGWHLIETKRFAEAILYLTKATEQEPNDFSAIINLAHACLFNNEYGKAIKGYREFIAKIPNREADQKELIKNDFTYFAKTGFDNGLLAKAAAELKIN